MNETIKTSGPATPRQKDVLTFIGEHIAEQGYSPSIREVAARFGYSSTRTAADLIDALHAKGHITRTRGVARSIQLTNRDTAA